MTNWAKFDTAIDEAKLRAEQQKAQPKGGRSLLQGRGEALLNARINKISQCAHRRNMRFYRVECAHPDRKPGKPCANLNCPDLFEG